MGAANGSNCESSGKRFRSKNHPLERFLAVFGRFLGMARKNVSNIPVFPKYGIA
jgi:hypothetical protein